MKFGEFVKRQRIGLAYSQRQVAMFSGLSNATISRIENGLVIPDTETIIQLAFALKMQPDTLFQLASDNNDQNNKPVNIDKKDMLSNDEKRFLAAYTQLKESPDPKDRAAADAIEHLLGLTKQETGDKS